MANAARRLARMMPEVAPSTASNDQLQIAALPSAYLPRMLVYAAVPAGPGVVVAGCLLLFSAVAGAGLLIAPVWASLLCAVLAASAPLLYLERRAESRAQEFALEYPSVLLATASSLQSGMTPYAALERSVRLLPINSSVRVEVAMLLRRLDAGTTRDDAVHAFAHSIRLPELSLFRVAFLLVLEHGGTFGPTLERLAAVSRERAILRRQATVATASMRMTANVLLFVTPVVLAMLAARTENYWQILAQHPTANSLGTVGALLIVGSYLVLRRMSAFGV